MNDTDSFLHGPVTPALFRFALPILGALFLQALYGAVDLWMVGQFSTPENMSAVSSGSQAMLIPNGVLSGLCLGLTILVSRTLGAGDSRSEGRILGSAALSAVLAGLILSLLLPLLAPGIARLIHTPPEALDQTISYLRICGGGAVFLVAFHGLSGLYRGIGDSRTPLIFVLIAALFNIAGDFILIRHFHLGATGAALATAGAQFLSVLLFLLHIQIRGFPLPVRRSDLAFSLGTCMEIIRLGGPVALQEVSNELFYMVLIGLTNTLGVIVSAGVGIAEKLIIFLLLIPVAYTSALSAFVARNAGAGQHARARSATNRGLLWGTLTGTAVSYLLFFHGAALSTLFTGSAPEVIESSALFLKATSLECLILSAAGALSGYFNGLGKTGFVMIQNLTAILLIKFPSAFLALKYAVHPLLHIGLSAVWGALFSLIILLIAFRLYRPAGTKS